jgi:hypothetical protein
MELSRRKMLALAAGGLACPTQLVAQQSWGGSWQGQSSSSNGRSVPGGLFHPAAPVHTVRRQHHIEVSFARKQLSYYRDGQPVRGYAVITPSGTRTRIGQVTDIIAQPTWTPGTSGMRLFRAGGGDSSMLVGGSVPYGHLLNPMGNYKFAISGFGAVRIHGTQSYDYDYTSVETLGCVRLMNGSPGINELVSMLGPQGIQEGIDVVFF